MRMFFVPRVRSSTGAKIDDGLVLNSLGPKIETRKLFDLHNRNNKRNVTSFRISGLQIRSKNRLHLRGNPLYLRRRLPIFAESRIIASSWKMALSNPKPEQPTGGTEQGRAWRGAVAKRGAAGRGGAAGRDGGAGRGGGAGRIGTEWGGAARGGAGRGAVRRNRSGILCQAYFVSIL